jgi:hypothetical protein
MMLEEVQKFIEETTGQTNIVQPMEKRIQVPQYLHALYDLLPARIHKLSTILAFVKNNEIPKTTDLKAHAKTLFQKTGDQVVFVFENMNPKKSATYVKNHLAFISLGNEIYLPFVMLKIHAVHQSSGPRQERLELTAWPQIIVTRQLVHKDVNGRTGTELAELFKVTKMTISRAIQELEATPVCKVVLEAQKKIIKFGSQEDIWHESYPMLRNPVHTIERIRHLPDGLTHILAATSALAAKTNLAEPAHQEVALDKRERKKFPSKSFTDGENNDDFYQVQFWNWNPAYTEKDGVVDPVSLYLSLRNTTDERIAMARDEFLQTIGIKPIKNGESI